MKKIFVLWSGAVVTILLSVPAVAGVIQLSHVGALIAFMNNHAVVAVVILIGGYVLIWTVFKQMDNVAGRLGDVASSATGKIQAGLKKSASNTLKRRTGEAVNGQRRPIRGAQRAVGAIRRFQNADHGGLSITRSGRDEYAAAEVKHMGHTVDEMMKRDGGASGGNDMLMEVILSRPPDEESGRRMYAERVRDSLQGAVNGGQITADQADAETARRVDNDFAALKVNFGAQFGSGAMRVAAYRSLLASNTSYTDPDGTINQQALNEIIEDGLQLMNEGLISSTGATQYVKANGERADRAGIGWGSVQGAFERAQTRHQFGARAGNAANPLIEQNEALDLRREALYGTSPQKLMLARHETVSALATVMRNDLMQSAQGLDNALTAAETVGLTSHDDQITAANSARALLAGNPNAVLNAQQQAGLQAVQAREAYDRQLGAISGRYDVLAAASPQNATIMANVLMSQEYANPLDRGGVSRATTTQQALEAARGNAGVVEMRREYTQPYQNPNQPNPQPQPQPQG